MLRSFIIFVLMISSPCVADCTYAHDDGTGYYNLGPSLWPADMCWGNYFQAVPQGHTIDSVSVAFGSAVRPGRDVEVVLMNDPTNDSDPGDAIVLTSVQTRTSEPNTAGFVHFDVPDTPVRGGFFVALVMDVAQSEYVAKMDPDTLGINSWLFFDAAIDLADLGGSPVRFNMANHAFNGTWMVRAHGVPEPVSGVLALLGVTLLSYRRTRENRHIRL